MKSTQEIFIDPRNFQNQEFFSNSQKTDPRVAEVLARAEQDFYRDKQRSNDLVNYQRRKQELEEKEARQRLTEQQDQKQMTVRWGVTQDTDDEIRRRTLLREQEQIMRIRSQNRDYGQSFNWETLQYHEKKPLKGFGDQPLYTSLRSPKQTLNSTQSQRSLSGTKVPKVAQTLNQQQTLIGSIGNQRFSTANKSQPRQKPAQHLKTTQPNQTIQTPFLEWRQAQLESQKTKKPKNQQSKTYSSFKILNNQKSAAVDSSVKQLQQIEIKAIRLIQNGDFQQAKLLLENEIKTKNCKQPVVFMLCGETNMHLGYLIVAEQMFIQAAEHRDYQAIALKFLGDVYFKQDYIDKALHYYKNSLEIDQNQHNLLYQIGYILVRQKQPSQAIEYLTPAIEIACGQALKVQPEQLANMFLTRMRAYEQLGLHEHAREDYQKVLVADPNFIQNKLKETQNQNQWTF